MRTACLAGVLLQLLSVLLLHAQTSEQSQPEGRITGIVINAEREPISQAHICKTITRPQFSSTTCGAAETDANGRFEVEHVEVGETGWYAEKQEAGYWNENGKAVQRVTLTPERLVASVILNVGAKPGELRIAVKDKVTGGPVKSCTIRTTQGDHAFIATNASTQTVRLRPLADVLIQVVAPGYKNWYYIDPADPSQPVLRLESGEQKSLDIELEAKQ